MRFVITALALAALFAGTAQADPFAFFATPTKWEPGPNTASIDPNANGPGGTYGTPGGATWSFVRGGRFSIIGPENASHLGLTAPIISLGVPGWGPAHYIAAVNAALNIWAAPSGFTNLGFTGLSGALIGAPDALGGAHGDIRVAAWELKAPGALAHTYQPGTQAIFGLGGTIGGDMHLDRRRIWHDDPTDTNADPDFDLFTVILHEMGHALGLGHSTFPASIMFPSYLGARRSLHIFDIAGIRAIYGPPRRIPEPACLLLLSFAAIGVRRYRRRA